MIRKRIVASMNDTVLVGYLLLQVGPCPQAVKIMSYFYFQNTLYFIQIVFWIWKIHSDKIKVHLNNPAAVFNARKSVMSPKVNVILKF